MRIIIRQAPLENDFYMEVEPYFTGLTIKKKIEYLYAIPSVQQFLSYESFQFKNDTCISDYDIKDGDSLNLTRVNHSTPESFPISYRTSNGIIKTVEVQPSYTIAYIKQMIFSQTGANMESIQLFFSGKNLEDQSRISDHRAIGVDSKIVAALNKRYS